MPTEPPPLSSRSRVGLFLTTIALLVAIAAVVWDVSGPTPEPPPPIAAASLAAAPETLPVSAAIIPTPRITPRTGLGGQAESGDPWPTPTLAPELVALTESELAPATPAPTEIPPTAVPPTEVPPTAVPPTEVPPTEPPPMIVSTMEPPQRPPINGVPYEVFIVMPDAVVARSREIYASGQAIGRNPHAYAKVGDSTTENPHFLARYDTGPYELGQFAALQPVIDFFLGSHGRDSVAVRVGMHSWTANDPAWADKSLCLPNESPVQCEIRLHNPSILLIRLGTNDVGVPGMFDGNIRQIVETAIAAGVIPVIGTKGDRHEGSNENNDILRQVATDYQVPLWDFDQVANMLPGRGLDEDAVHMMTFFSHDFNDPTAFTRGHAMHNLTALMMLDAIWREAMDGGPR